jgi:membrane associated rhomboid family serine protease
MYYLPTIGASGAIFGLLIAWALYFPHRQIYMYFLFPVPVRIYVLIFGAMSLYAAVTNTQGGVAHVAHLGGLLVGWLYLRSGTLSVHPIAEIKYRYLKWKINRGRRKFDVYSGGRSDDVNRRIH